MGCKLKRSDLHPPNTGEVDVLLRLIGCTALIKPGGFIKPRGFKGATRRGPDKNKGQKKDLGNRGPEAKEQTKSRK